MTFDEFVNSPLRPLNQTGTVFIDALHAAGKHMIANGLAVGKDDPFGKPSVPVSAVAFVQRNWDFYDVR